MARSQSFVEGPETSGPVVGSNAALGSRVPPDSVGRERAAYP
ncbi:hypothetical protein [Phycicoccus elongatus]|nr:hypothetical protein [Phycicoccus elongatus]